MRFWFQMRSMSQNKIMVFSDSFITLEYMLISLRSISSQIFSRYQAAEPHTGSAISLRKHAYSNIY